VNEDKVCAVLVQVLYTEKIICEKQVSKYAPIFKQFLKGEKTQKSLLGGLLLF
jgi:hypothetical protein